MANSVTHAGLPFPVKGARFTIEVPYLDADGDPTDPTTPDTETSKDAGTFADCAEEVATISGSNGVGYITLTGSEMDGVLVAVVAKVASGPKATIATLHPRVLPVLFSGTAQAGASGSITLAPGSPAFSLGGCIVRTTGGTGGGGTGGANNQARVITAYDTSTKVASVIPNWETNPSSDTTYEILMTEMWDPSGRSAWLTWEESRANHVTSGTVGLANQITRDGTAQAGETATVTLDAGASASNDVYNNETIHIYAGTGAGQTARISNYVGSTKVATIGHDWIVQPDNTSKFIIYPTRWGGSVDNVLGVVAGQAHGVAVSGVGVLAQNEDSAKIATSAAAADMKAILDKLDSLIEASGGHNRYKATALEQSPTGGSAPSAEDIRTEMDSNSTKLAHLDADISTRLAGSGYTAPPTVAAIRGEMDSNSTKLAHLDADISTRLASVSYAAPDNSGISEAIDRITDVQDRLPTALVGGKMPAALSGTLAEPSPGQPTATPTVEQAISVLYFTALNPVSQTNTEKRVLKRDGSAALWTVAMADDGTTYTEGVAEAP